MFNVDVNKKNLLEIQNALKDAHYDALIVPHEDEFLGEYISEDKQRLAFLLGFTGSNITFCRWTIYHTSSQADTRGSRNKKFPVTA